MTPAVVLLHLLNFVFVGLLPLVFFTPGRYSWRWWLTGGPFFVDALLLLAGFFGVIAPGVPTGRGRAGLEALSVTLAAGSIALIAFTLGTHRIPIALWHQADDAPRHIVTWGAYGRVRHPFYASFLLALLGAAIVCPHPATAAVLLYGAVALNLTAAREEKRLLQSEFGAEYEAYMRRAGRFIPRFRTS